MAGDKRNRQPPIPTPGAEKMVQNGGDKKRQRMQESTHDHDLIKPEDIVRDVQDCRNDKLRKKNKSTSTTSGNEASMTEDQKATKALLCVYFPGECGLMPCQTGKSLSTIRYVIHCLTVFHYLHFQNLQRS